MNFQTITLKKEERIATLTLSRPEKLNAINAQMEEELITTLGDIAQDTELRVMILTGEGRAFCSGGDISEPRPDFQGKTIAELSHMLRRLYLGITFQLYNLEIPTIAMVNGFASGWGFDLSLACDLRVGSENSRFSVAFTRVGITPATGGVWLMPQVMGYSKAAELTFTADNMEAKEAERLGILNRVVAADDLERETMILAKKIAKFSPVSIKLAKHQLRRGLQTDFATAVEYAATCQPICLVSEDFKEAIAAFREKREPVFKGR